MGKIYASSDWHGCSVPAKKLLSYLKEDDTLYFLGDSIDRGPDGLELFELLIKDPRVIYLKGNHEVLMYNALEGMLRGEFGIDYYLWIQNGGQHTLSTIENIPDYLKKVKKIISKIYKMPLQKEYKSPKGHKVILDHAGFTIGPVLGQIDSCWNREHFKDEWCKEKKFDNVYIVHGHTPVQYLQFEYGYHGRPQFTKEEIAIRHSWYDLPTDYEWKPEVIRYCDGHKFDIDMCTIVSDRIALLDLDTFEVKYFDN